MKQPPAPQSGASFSLHSKVDPGLTKDLADLGLSLDDIIPCVVNAEARAKSKKPLAVHRTELSRMSAKLSEYEAAQERLREMGLSAWVVTALVLSATKSTCLECGASTTTPNGKDAVMLKRERQTRKGPEVWLSPAPSQIWGVHERIIDLTYATTNGCLECFYTSAQEALDLTQVQLELSL